MDGVDNRPPPPPPPPPPPLPRSEAKPKTAGGKWSQEEDDRLREVVREHGPKNWKVISKLAFNGARSDVQCLHRWQKVLRPGLVKGPWLQSEDEIIVHLISKHGLGHIKWSEIAASLPGRLGKQCRERWVNHLDPDLKKSPWTEEEDRILMEKQVTMGNKWREIAAFLPGRSENSVKNRWNSAKRKRKRTEAALAEQKAIANGSGEVKPKREKKQPRPKLAKRQPRGKSAAGAASDTSYQAGSSVPHQTASIGEPFDPSFHGVPSRSGSAFLGLGLPHLEQGSSASVGIPTLSQSSFSRGSSNPDNHSSSSRLSPQFMPPGSFGNVPPSRGAGSSPTLNDLEMLFGGPQAKMFSSILGGASNGSKQGSHGLANTNPDSTRGLNGCLSPVFFNSVGLGNSGAFSNIYGFGPSRAWGHGSAGDPTVKTDEANRGYHHTGGARTRKGNFTPPAERAARAQREQNAQGSLNGYRSTQQHHAGSQQLPSNTSLHQPEELLDFYGSSDSLLKSLVSPPPLPSSTGFGLGSGNGNDTSIPDFLKSLTASAGSPTPSSDPNARGGAESKATKDRGGDLKLTIKRSGTSSPTPAAAAASCGADHPILARPKKVIIAQTSASAAHEGSESKHVHGFYSPAVHEDEGPVFAGDLTVVGKSLSAKHKELLHEDMGNLEDKSFFKSRSQDVLRANETDMEVLGISMESQDHDEMFELFTFDDLVGDLVG